MERTLWQRTAAFVMALILMLACASTALAYDTLRYGQTSTAIEKMQEALKELGYYKGEIDGFYGDVTKAAVIKFQKKRGLVADGKAGDKTLTALYHRTSSNDPAKKKKPKNKNTLAMGSTGIRVEKLQRALKQAGFYSGVIDGEYGDRTFLAVQQFQKAKYLYVDGMAGTKTLALLNLK